jgi:O-methyltransferase
MAIYSGNDEFSASDWEAFERVFAIANDFSMCGRERLQNLYLRTLEVCRRYPDASCVDCGVAAGGSSAVIAAALASCTGNPNRRVYCFDTFKGLPAPGPLDTREGSNAAELGWGEGTCAADQSSLRTVCQKLGVDQHVVPVEGLFEHTLPQWSERIGPIALLHMDGDWYDSTLQILHNLYGPVMADGVIQVDDYGYWEGCRRAVHDYFLDLKLQFRPHVIDSTGVWIRKSEIIPLD